MQLPLVLLVLVFVHLELVELPTSSVQPAANKLMKTERRSAGFTMIEIMVVVAIIAVLTTIGIISYSSTQKKARDGKRKADLEQVRSALVLYRTDNGVYTTTLTWTTMAPITSYISGSSISDPKPLPHVQYTYTSATGATFSLCATLEATTPSSYCLTNP